jgi:hypothetical protein
MVRHFLDSNQRATIGYYKGAMPVTITIELAPELEAELARQAASQGIGIDAYAAGLLKDAARLPNVPAVAFDKPPAIRTLS